MSDFEHSLNPYRYEERSRASDHERQPWRRFDRVAFALRALRVLMPTNIRIAVFRSSRLQVSQGIDLASSYFYSDSYNDLPMLERVGHAIAINPDARLARLAKQRGWPMMRWS